MGKSRKGRRDRHPERARPRRESLGPWAKMASIFQGMAGFSETCGRYTSGMKDHPPGSVKPRAIHPPKVPAWARLQNVHPEEISDQAELEAVRINDVDLTDCAAAHMQIRGAEITNGRAIGAEFERLQLRDVRIADADWSNMNMFGSGWTRVSITGTKLVGARLNESSLRDVSFEDCIGDLLQAQMATFERVGFVRCRLRGAIFNQSDLSNVVFDGCDLREADFSHAVLTGADVRRSDLEGIQLGPDQLRGLIVTPDQALYLAGAIGLVIDA